VPLSYPNFQSAEFLESHIESTLDFYAPRAFAAEGGFHSSFLDDGTCTDPGARQLVGSARYVFNYAESYRRYGDAQHLHWAEWGLDFLKTAHRQANGGYAWRLDNGEVTDSRVMAYGHAFVILAAAACHRIGITGAGKMLTDVFDFMETYFWDEAASAYNDERDASLQTLSPYRGQNANMHMCEAMLAAWQATGKSHYLDRAERLAHAKWLPKAQSLYDTAIEKGWDKTHGGIFYGVAPNGSICADEKHFWVQAESFAAAWRLYKAGGGEKYRQDYERIWQWCWAHMIDHKYGAWFRTRHRDGSAVNKNKSPLGKTDYHTMGACWDVLTVGV